jgi:predicted CopG family antitoxin
MLRAIKKKDESFSMLFERLVKSKKNVEILRELKGSVKFERKEDFLREIRKKRLERRY